MARIGEKGGYRRCGATGPASVAGTFTGTSGGAGALMILLDENISEDQCKLLRNWRIRFRQIGWDQEVTKEKVSSEKEKATTEDSVTLSSLQRERDELSRRLNDALVRLAGHNLAEGAGAYSHASPDSGPQHDQLLLSFRQLKLQDFQALSFGLYSIWQKRPGNDATKPAYALALCREKLSREVLLEGSKLLTIRRSVNPDHDLDDIRQTIYDAIRTRFKMKNAPPAVLEDKMKETIARSLDLLRAMALARPAGCLLVAPHKTPFQAEVHEPVVGCPDQPTARVQLTVFPGYLVTSSNRVLEKALVYTE
jgi:hypothetical protein